MNRQGNDGQDGYVACGVVTQTETREDRPSMRPRNRAAEVCFVWLAIGTGSLTVALETERYRTSEVKARPRPRACHVAGDQHWRAIEAVILGISPVGLRGVGLKVQMAKESAGSLLNIGQQRWVIPREYILKRRKCQDH